MRHHNMEEDAFGFARFPRHRDPDECRVEVFEHNEAAETARPGSASSSPEPGHNL
jgi:hypothetical protein